MIFYTIAQKIYLSTAILGGLVIIFLLWLLFYKNYFKKHRLSKSVGYQLYRFSNLNDYLLLNDYKIHIDDTHIGKIDHVLITNKFIIIINDFNISGVISGDYTSEQLKLTDAKGDKLIHNPLNYNCNLTKRIALFNDLDNSFLKGIVVVNDDAMIDIDNIPNQFSICSKKDLKRIIKEFDKEEVKPFKENTIVNFINVLNERNISGDKR